MAPMGVDDHRSHGVEPWSMESVRWSLKAKDEPRDGRGSEPQKDWSRKGLRGCYLGVRFLACR
jgi:hypothetical protein